MNHDARPTLLIADDDAVVRSALGAQLEGDFRVVAVAETVAEAVELAEHHQPDAALVDVEMPEGGAQAAVPQITARSPGTSIVILSGDESRDSVLELLSAGAIAYIRKGIPTSDIAKTLTDALGAKGDEQRT
jgi:two-component system nitrogen regulation response regulator GlnG